MEVTVLSERNCVFQPKLDNGHFLKPPACNRIIQLAAFQDPFKYSYPPLPDDDFQTPTCENGPIADEDEAESKEGEIDSKDALESSFSSEIAVKPKKVHFLSSKMCEDECQSVLKKKKSLSPSYTVFILLKCEAGLLHVLRKSPLPGHALISLFIKMLVGQQ